MKEIWKNSARLISANVIAQAIGIIVYPLITRLYGPEDLGSVNLFLSIGGILAILATAEYQYAIVLPEKEDVACGVSQMGMLLLLVVTLFSVLVLPLSPLLMRWLNAPSALMWYMLIPVYVFLTGSWNLLKHWLIRKKKFSYVSGYILSQSATSAGCKIGFGYAGWLSMGLIFASVIGGAVGLVAMMGASLKKLPRQLWKFNKKSCLQAAKEFKNFPLYSLPRALVNTLVCSLPIFILSSYFDMQQVGYISLALTVSFLPINLIAGSFNQVIYQAVAEKVTHHETIVSFCRDLLLKVGGVAFPFFVAIFFLAPWLVRVLFGEGWNTTAQYVIYMLPFLYTTLLCGPLSGVADVFGKQKISAIIEVFYMLLVLGALLLGSLHHNDNMAIMAYSAVGTGVMIFQIAWYFCLMRKYEKSL